MAILTFSYTAEEFKDGKKTVTRRTWADKHFRMWQNLWDANKLEHDAWDKIPIAGGKQIGQFRLTKRPYEEYLKDMPQEDLAAEGGMCESLEEYFNFIGQSPDTIVKVIRFEKL